jgi:hypothetical protein
MKNAISLIAFVCLATLAGCSNTPNAPETGKSKAPSNNSVNAPKAQDGPEAAKANDPNRTLSIDQYDKLVVGISRADAEQIIGWKGTSNGGPETDKSTTVMWKTAGPESIVAIFTEDKLTHKMQFNLK